MQKYILIMGLIAGPVLLGTVALADKEPLQPQTRCPVLDGKINKSLFVEYDGKRIYVCCKECIATVQKDPAKFAGELESKGVTLEKAQTICPVLGGKIDKKVYTDYNGKRVYFCCAGCIEQFKAEPEKYLKKFEAEGVVLEPVPASTESDKKAESSGKSCPMMPKSEKSGHSHGSGGGCM